MKVQKNEEVMWSHNENHSVIYHYLGMSMNEMRHLEIQRIIREKSISTIMDYGCNEGEFVRKLARSEDMRLLVALDIEQNALASAVLNTYPENIQTSIQYYRQEDQNIHIIQADVTKMYHKLKDFNTQLITLVQLIEHLVIQDVTKAMKNIFGFMKPRYCFISTPNRQFNSFFNNSQKDSFRHWDHKFQWTRQEFSQFCQKIKEQFGYDYYIKGIGENLSDQSKGYCTQYALFTKPQQLLEKHQELLENQAQLVQKVHYTNKSWKNNLQDIMQTVLYKCLYTSSQITYENAINMIKNQPIGQCLSNRNEVIDLPFIRKYLQLFADRFQFDDQMFKVKRALDSQMEDEEDEQFNCSFEELRNDKELLGLNCSELEGFSQYSVSCSGENLQKKVGQFQKND